jgi:hypothetical protein
MPDHVSCPRCGCACRVQPHDHAHCVQCFTSFRPSQVESHECRHCGEPFASLLGAGTEAGRLCAACGQYEGFPDANPPRCATCAARHRADEPCATPMSAVRGCWPAKPCPRCGQMSTAAGVCAPCRDLARAPQGEAVRLFTPAPAQLPGQLNL